MDRWYWLALGALTFAAYRYGRRPAVFVAGLVLLGICLLTLLWAGLQTSPEWGLLVVVVFIFLGVPGLILTTIGGVRYFLRRKGRRVALETPTKREDSGRARVAPTGQPKEDRREPVRLDDESVEEPYEDRREPHLLGEESSWIRVARGVNVLVLLLWVLAPGLLATLLFILFMTFVDVSRACSSVFPSGQ